MEPHDAPSTPPVPELFADGLFDIGFGNGVVRLDLFSLSATRRDAGGQPLPELRQRVIMTLPGFLSALAAMEGMRQRLTQAGVLTPPPASVPPAAPDADGNASPRSPNFE